MVMHKYFLSLVCLIFVLSGCNDFSQNNTKNSFEDSNNIDFEQIIVEKEIDLYEDILKNNNVKKISLDQLNIIAESNEKNSLIYFGKSPCVYCRKLIIANEEAIRKSPIKIFYVDIESLTSEDKKKLGDFQVIEVPAIIEINENSEYVKIDIEEFERRVHNV